MVNSISCSIIIPCYNEARNLPALLKKCEQLFLVNKNLEIIIVDNGSTDNTFSILNELTKKFSFITRVNIKKNKGYGSGILAGLRVANGEVLGWTHADLQTDPIDLLDGLNFFKNAPNPELLFVKGKRYGRPFFDIIFTMAMSFFEILLLRKFMWDINAQPTMFHRNFFLNWQSPPEDFSLDLYAYYLALISGLKIHRFKVHFGKRIYGVSNWNFSFASKYKFIKRTLRYSFELKNKMR